MRCHEEHPWLKFVNVCGDAKSAVDACFREEKVMRKKLNKQVGPMYPLKPVLQGKGPAGRGDADVAA